MMEHPVQHPTAAMSPQVVPPSQGQNAQSQTTQETLMARLRAQVEFYFSGQNLSRDTYLRNLLSTYGGSVPLSIIANFPKVRDLCSTAFGITNKEIPADPALLMRSLEGSNVVYVTPDAQWISPKLPLPPMDPAASAKQRTLPLPIAIRTPPISTASTPDNTSHINADSRSAATIILRDITSDAAVSQVMSIFTNVNIVPQSARREAGNILCVTFASEQDAQAAYSGNKDKLIDGIPIAAKIKGDVKSAGIPSSPSPDSAATSKQGNTSSTVNVSGKASASHPQQLPQQQQGPHQPLLQQTNTRPAMVGRAHSSPAHYNLNNGQHQSVPAHMPPPQGMPVPAGAVPGYYNYGYRSMPPGNYHGTGFVYPHHVQHPPPPGTAPLQYMYPYTYVPANSHNYFQPGVGRPVLVRDNSGRSQRSGPYENGHLRQGNNMGGPNAGMKRQDGVPKQQRKNRNKKGLVQNYDQGQGQSYGGGGMPTGRNRGSKESLNNNSSQLENDYVKRDNMPRNRSQNEMSDSSGGGKTTKRKKDKFKKKSQGGERRKDEVTLDANNFPALSDMSPVKAQTGTDKSNSGGMGFSGYADALRQKNKPAPSSPSPVGSAKDETTLAEQVNDLKVSSKDSSQSESVPVAVGALTGTPTSAEECAPLDTNSIEVYPIEETNDTVKKVETEFPAKGTSADDSKSENEESTIQTKTHADQAEVKSENDLISEPSIVQEEPSVATAAPPAAWGNKRSFIDVVRKS